ncbi:putative porin [Methyloglobulus sp.]|uniref:putative porin n=1 Tax=Methyloglobulus sp. TaxID=2518622 RepID=UPI0032B7F156
MDNKNRLLVLTLCSLVGVVQAGEKEELLKLRNTTTNLIKELVKQGVLTGKVAEDMIKKAEADAESQVQQQAEQIATTEPAAEAPEPGEVRVPYVPQFVKDEIRQQVRTELREEVVGDVMQKAKNEKWGIPDALPDWINRFTLSGDMRLRSQNDFMSGDNAEEQYLNYQEINSRGGRTGINDFINTTKDRHRFRERVRLAIDAKITDNLKAGIRLATGNQPDPVSTNQSLGNTGNQYNFNVDRAYLKYDAVNDEGFKWLTLAGGRIANPWYVGGGEFTGGSELVWDTDLSFEGFAMTARHSLGSSKSVLDKHDDSRKVYATAGAFPLQETELSSSGKWLMGGQVGLDWGFENQDALKVGISYYDYINIQAKPNSSAIGDCDKNTAQNNLSVPQFLQFGNTLTGICEGLTTQGESKDPVGDGNPRQYGLASDYNIINVNLSYDLAKFAPYHVIFGADFAKNVGFDKQTVNNYRYSKVLGSNNLNDDKIVDEETNAWQVRMDFGWPKVDRAGKWNVFALYKYVERDAVLDGFTDSDFHLGGTNAKGWVIGGNFGLMKNLWFTGRWLSTDVITGPTYGNDVLQLDLNAKF